MKDSDLTIRYKVALFEDQGHQILAATTKASHADEWEKYGHFKQWLTSWVETVIKKDEKTSSL